MTHQTDSEPDPLTVNDLPRVFFRAAAASDADGQTVDAASATDDQFDAWARERVILLGHSDHRWPPEDRAALCDRLHRLGALALATPAVREVLAKPPQAGANEAVLLEAGSGSGGESGERTLPTAPAAAENRESADSENRVETATDGRAE